MCGNGPGLVWMSPPSRMMVELFSYTVVGYKFVVVSDR
jgi:hypothetical protein